MPNQKIELTATVSGAPAAELLRALEKPAAPEFNLGRIAAKFGQKALLESNREFRYQVRDGVKPEYEIRNLGGAIEWTATNSKDNTINFFGKFSTDRLTDESQPTENRLVTTYAFVSREANFSGKARPGETVTLEIGGRGEEKGKLMLAFKIVE